MRERVRSATAYTAILAISLLLLLPAISVGATSEADAEAQYRKGDDLMALEQCTAAIDAWQKVLSDYSNQKRVCANAKLAVGRAYRVLGQIENAQQQFNGLIASYPDFHRQGAEALLELGRILEGQGEPSQAIAKYRSVVNLHLEMESQCAESKLRVAGCLTASGNEEQALDELSDLLADYPEELTQCAEARMRLGQALAAKGLANEAITQFQRIQSDYGGLDLWGAEALLWLGSTQDKAGQTDSALASYTKALNDYPGNRAACLKAVFAKAQIREKAGAAAEAISDYEAILKDYPAFQRQADTAKARIQSLLPAANLSAEASAGLQETLARYDQVRDSVALDGSDQDSADKSGVAADYPRIRADRVKAILRKGEALRGLQQYEQAKAEFRKILTAYDDTSTWQAQAKLEFGRTERKGGSLSQALNTFADIISANRLETSECAYARLYRGEIYEELGAYDDASIEYRSVLQNYSDKKGRSGAARYQLGLLLKKTGKENEALTEFAALYSDTTNLPEYVFPALEAALQTLEPQKRFRDAVAAADTVIAGFTEPGKYRARALHLKSLVQCNARRYADAAATLRNSISQHGNDISACRRARMLLVQSLLMNRKRQDALGVLNEMSTMDGWTREEQAFIKEYTSFCYKYSDPARAEALLTELIDSYSDTSVAPDAYFHRSVLRANRGAYEEAISDIPMVDAAHLRHFAMANLCFVQGRYANAAPEYEQVLTSLPAGYKGSYCEIVEAAGKLAACYQKLGQNEKATEAFRKLIKLEIEHVLPAF